MLPLQSVEIELVHATSLSVQSRYWYKKLTGWGLNPSPELRQLSRVVFHNQATSPNSPHHSLCLSWSTRLRERMAFLHLVKSFRTYSEALLHHASLVHLSTQKFQQGQPQLVSLSQLLDRFEIWRTCKFSLLWNHTALLCCRWLKSVLLAGEKLSLLAGQSLRIILLLHIWLSYSLHGLAFYIHFSVGISPPTLALMPVWGPPHSNCLLALWSFIYCKCIQPLIPTSEAYVNLFVERTHSKLLIFSYTRKK
jgi:hypothetical protein